MLHTIHRPLALSAAVLGGLLAAGCAIQPPHEQISPRPATVRVCEGADCADRPRLSGNGPAAPGALAPSAAEQQLLALEAAAQGNPQAAYQLAQRLLQGDAQVPRDAHRAIEWLREAASHGLRQAQSALGQIYLHGLQEMGADPAEALVWLTQAAAQGDKTAEKLIPTARAGRDRAQADYEAAQQRKQAAQDEANVWIEFAPLNAGTSALRIPAR